MHLMQSEVMLYFLVCLVTGDNHNIIILVD